MSTLPAIDTASALEALLNSSTVHRNLHSGVLVEQAIRRGEGLLADNGALVTDRLIDHASSARVVEAIDLLRGWRQTNQIETDTPDQYFLGSERGRLQALFLETRQDEGVNWIVHPTGVVHFGNRGTGGLGIGPVF